MSFLARFNVDNQYSCVLDMREQQPVFRFKEIRNDIIQGKEEVFKKASAAQLAQP